MTIMFALLLAVVFLNNLNFSYADGIDPPPIRKGIFYSSTSHSSL